MKNDIFYTNNPENIDVDYDNYNYYVYLKKQINKYNYILDEKQDKELQKIENEIFDTDKEDYKIAIAFSDLCEEKKDYNGDLGYVIIELLKQIYLLIKEANTKAKRGETVDYEEIKQYINCCSILMEEDISFFEALKYMDPEKIPKKIVNLAEGEEKNARR